MSNLAVVVASVRSLENLRSFGFEDVDVLVVDEEDRKTREKNREILGGMPVTYSFWGPKERSEWFKQRNFKSPLPSVIPERCHAETSFGFLVAYEKGAEVIIELDDDVWWRGDGDFVKQHLDNLNESFGLQVVGDGWYSWSDIHLRGIPYSANSFMSTHGFLTQKTVLNVGLWNGALDCDALTLISHGKLDGRLMVENITCPKKVVPGEGVYVPVCSMNTAFRRQIVPAFYQLYMTGQLDRFDDVWSGIFLKKICDHLGKKISLGYPLVYHDKTPRNVFQDLRRELMGLEINEYLWLIVQSISLEGTTFSEAYLHLADELESRIKLFDKEHQKFIQMQTCRMKWWVHICDCLR